MHFNITLDGPAGSGKSTIAKLFTKINKNFIHINTGSMYRAIAYFLFINNININDINSIEDNIKKINIHLDNDNVYLNNENISKYIRTNNIDYITSIISTYPCVRNKLILIQQEIASKNNVIMDGRDIGSVVLPNAQLKIYLDASVDVRAKRRFKENPSVNLSVIKQEIIKRDNLDKTRVLSPLIVPNNGIIIDTSNLTIDEVVNKIDSLYKNFK